jgi:large subunit ribosomal protein L25
MTMEQALSVSLRQERGKNANHRLRAQGEIPGIIYGPRHETHMVAVNRLQLERQLRALAHDIPVLDVELVDGDGTKTPRRVAIKEVQYHRVTDAPLHVDFYAFDPTRELTLPVPVHLQGRPVGIDKGGILQTVARNLQVTSLPESLPKRITLEVDELDIGEGITVGDIRERFSFHLDEEDGKVIVHVIALRKAKVSEGEGAEGEGEEGETAEGEGGEKAADENKAKE